MSGRKIIWASHALGRVDEIFAHIAQDNSQAAQRVAARIKSAAQSLAMLPSRGRNGRLPGTRELVLNDAPYIIAYRVTPLSVEILTVVHVAQKWPDQF